MTRPIPRQQKLALAPTRQPQFSVEVSFSTGKIKLADPDITRVLVALMDMEAVLGGAASHFGGPAAFAEMMSALHGVVFKLAGKKWFDSYNVVNDAGHCENGLYALKANYGMAGLDIEGLRNFRSMESPLTGHGESHLFPEGVLLSNGPLGSTLSQAQGLAMADKLTGNKRLTCVSISDGACMEGEARESLASIPGLAAKSKLNPFVLLISDNNTKLSGRIDEDCYDMTPTFSSLEEMGWNLIKIEDGHDIQACTTAVEEGFAAAKANPEKPVALWFKTIKGYGTKKTMKSASGAHGFPFKSTVGLEAFVKELHEDRDLPPEIQFWLMDLLSREPDSKKKKPEYKYSKNHEKIQKGVARALIGAKEDGLPLVSITSDLPGSTGVAEFRAKYPKESFDVGVAESNMISVATGFSKNGYIPVVDTFAAFGVTKGALPLVMSSLSQCPMIGIFSHTGFQDAADGASHQSLTYFSMLKAIPNLECHFLSCSSEAEALVGQAIKDIEENFKSGKDLKSHVFFLGRENFPSYFKNGQDYKLGENYCLIKQEKPIKTVVTNGSLVKRAYDQIMEQELNYDLVVAPTPYFSKLGILEDSLKQSEGKLVVMEDHQLRGGFGETLVAQLMENNSDLVKTYEIKAVKGDFGRSAYTANELYRRYDLNL